MKTRCLWRLLAFAFLLTGSGVGQAQDSDMVYFLVGERSEVPADRRRYDSYVISIPESRTDALLHARGLIAGTINNHLVVAGRIHAGADGINHNLTHPDQPIWNWHVEFHDFVFHVIDGEGYPSLVELNPGAWDGRNIGFPAYTVVRELGEQPLEVTIQPEGRGVRLNWWTPVSNQVFTVESTASLTTSNWQPLPGNWWPTTARRWTDVDFSSTAYYRVTATESRLVYFLVGERPEVSTGRRNDSYVLAIPESRTNALLHARGLISGTVQNNSTVASWIRAGVDGINHNLTHPDLPPWSWHVVFRDFVYTVLEGDGYPSLVELNPGAWDGRSIGFSGYTVLRELGDRPLEVTIQTEGQGVRLNWWTPLPNQVFTVESTTSLTNPDWQPLPGVGWPTTVREWTIADSVPDTHYRVTMSEAGEAP